MRLVPHTLAWLCLLFKFPLSFSISFSSILPPSLICSHLYCTFLLLSPLQPNLSIDPQSSLQPSSMPSSCQPLNQNLLLLWSLQIPYCPSTPAKSTATLHVALTTQPFKSHHLDLITLTTLISALASTLTPLLPKFHVALTTLTTCHHSHHHTLWIALSIPISRLPWPFFTTSNTLIPPLSWQFKFPHCFCHPITSIPKSNVAHAPPNPSHYCHQLTQLIALSIPISILLLSSHLSDSHTPCCLGNPDPFLSQPPPWPLDCLGNSYFHIAFTILPLWFHHHNQQNHHHHLLPTNFDTTPLMPSLIIILTVTMAPYLPHNLMSTSKQLSARISPSTKSSMYTGPHPAVSQYRMILIISESHVAYSSTPHQA